MSATRLMIWEIITERSNYFSNKRILSLAFREKVKNDKNPLHIIIFYYIYKYMRMRFLSLK